MQMPSCLYVKASALVVMAIFAGSEGLWASTPVSLLDDKLKLELPDGFSMDESRLTNKVIASFKARKGSAWGAVTRGTRSLEVDGLGEYLSRKAEEYTKGLSWLPKLTWLKKDTITIHGRKWADLRFIAQMDKPRGPMDGIFYTRILATSYEGRLLEIVLTSNTDRGSETKAKIDRILESVKLED